MNQQEFDNEQFLDEFARAFYFLSLNKVAALKKIDGEYIAATPAFTNLVGYQSIDKIINTRDEQLPCDLALFSDLYKKHDILVQKHKNTLSFLEVHEFSTGLGIYIFNRTPIVNPATNKILAIEINVEPLQTRNMLETMICIHKKNESLKSSQKNLLSDNIKLGEKQLEVLFCLIMGIKEDKAISEFMRYIKHVDTSIDSIKSIIKRLLRKFNVNTRDQLIEFVIANKIHTFIPRTFIKYGSFLLNDSSTVLNIN